MALGEELAARQVVEGAREPAGDGLEDVDGPLVVAQDAVDGDEHGDGLVAACAGGIGRGLAGFGLGACEEGGDLADGLGRGLRGGGVAAAADAHEGVVGVERGAEGREHLVHHVAVDGGVAVVDLEGQDGHGGGVDPAAAQRPAREGRPAPVVLAAAHLALHQGVAHLWVPLVPGLAAALVQRQVGVVPEVEGVGPGLSDGQVVDVIALAAVEGHPLGRELEDGGAGELDVGVVALEAEVLVAQQAHGHQGGRAGREAGHVGGVALLLVGHGREELAGAVEGIVADVDLGTPRRVEGHDHPAAHRGVAVGRVEVVAPAARAVL